MTRAALATAAIALVAFWGCKPKVTRAQCDELRDRYASLVVSAKMKDAPPAAVAAEQRREAEEARSDDDFKNCTTELSLEDYQCAMRAPSADALEKCLE